MLRQTLRNNAFFLVPYLIVLLCLIPFLLIYSKTEIHLWINHYYCPFSDFIFTYLTYLGDGLFIIIPAIILLFISLRHSVFILTAYLSTGLVTQILKRVFFHDIMRPSKVFHDHASLHMVEGIKMLSGRSFPSGHSTSAFAIFLCLALIIPNKKIKLIGFIIACLVAFSRIYLSQHFLIDTIAGSLIGIMGTLALYQLFYKDDRKWHQWTVLKLFCNYVPENKA
jgi:membrane-associated phospholipid phosphatase